MPSRFFSSPSVVFLGSLALVACGSGNSADADADSDSAATGGAGLSGGSANAGGGPGSGGATNTGGTIASGGGPLGSGGATAGTGGVPTAGAGGVPTAGTGGDGAGGEDGEPPEDPLLGDVSFSVPSQTFEGQLEVGLSATGEIRYTVDGSVPTADSPLWDGSVMTLTETTQLRAAVFVDGVLQGRPSAAIYIRRTFDTSADVPIVIMEGYVDFKPDPENKVDWNDLGVMVFEPPEGGTASLSDLPTTAARAGYRVRGQSSANFPKTPYRVELWGTEDDDADQPFVGMPSESDWAFVGPCADRSLIRNALVYSLGAEMNLSTMQLRFAEVYINQDGGPLEQSDFEGVYAVTQSIKNQKTRLDLKQLREDDIDLPTISGGYIFKFDQRAVSEEEGEVFVKCRGADGEVIDNGAEGCWEDMELVDPAPANEQQMAYIEGEIQTLHDLLHAEPLGDYQSRIDLPSFIDHFVINELTMDVDAYIRSHYMHKDRDGLIKAGPLWDYNFAMGSIGAVQEDFTYNTTRSGNGTNDWHLIMGPDPTFHEQLAARYRELRVGILSDAELFARIDQIAAPLVNAATRDLQRWPVGECGFGGFGPGPGPGGVGGSPAVEEDWTLSDPTVALMSWQSELDDLKAWLSERLAWLDSQWLL